MRRNSAFSLVELSIVLVILGLLVGGILGGQSLIRGAEIRNLGKEYQTYVAAAQSFKDKYFSLPGDFATATLIWGKNSAKCNGHSGTAATPGTCNGDSDYIMDYGASAAASGEGFQFWNQLVLAGMLEGSYTGYAGTANFYHAVPGTNIPASKVTNGAWTMETTTADTGDANTFASPTGNGFMFGAAVSNAAAYGKVLKPEEAWNFDTKFDDGKPGYGNIMAMYWNNMCSAADDGSSANSDLNASYRLQDNTIQCALKFRRNF